MGPHRPLRAMRPIAAGASLVMRTGLALTCELELRAIPEEVQNDGDG
jgi:hypothetical protein